MAILIAEQDLLMTFDGIGSMFITHCLIDNDIVPLSDCLIAPLSHCLSVSLF